MTVAYNAEVATSSFGCFLKLLLRWRASIYKIIWMDVLIYLLAYYSLSLSYRFLMDEYQKTQFELLVDYCNSSSTLIPVSFVLGFYVTVVMRRWWDQYTTVPWPDPLAVYVSTLVVGQDERGRAMRRTLMRYVCLTLTMVLTMVAPCVKRRFPTLNHMVTAGILTENEKDVLESTEEKQVKQAKHWVPMVWAASIASRARKEGRIRDDVSLKSIIDELDQFRNGCAMILHFDAVPIPLVYTQVVTLAVYSYFLGSIFGNQWTDKTDAQGYLNIVDYYFPFFTMLEFFFYMGWLKVAESLMNPFGEDDDDFEVNWLIDRNLQVSYLIVDEMHHEHPELVRDQYWDEVLPNELPYPDDLAEREEPPEPSTARYDFNKSMTVMESASLYITKLRENRSTTLGRLNQLEHKASREHGHSSSSSSHEKIDERVSKQLSVRYSTETDLHSAQPVAVSTRPSADVLVRASTMTTQIKPSPPTSEQTSEQDNEQDDFELLRAERERERAERQKQKLLQNVYTAASVTAGLNSTQQANKAPRLLLESLPITESSHTITSVHSESESAQEANIATRLLLESLPINESSQTITSAHSETNSTQEGTQEEHK